MFPQNAPAYRALFWLFCPITQCVFTPKIPKKVNFSLNCAYNTGHFIGSFPDNLAIFWFFCPIIQCVFTQKILKKLIFSQIAPKIQGTLLTFLPKKVIFSQNSPAYRALLWLFYPIIQCVFTPKTPKKLIFPQISHIIQGT